MTIPPQTQAAFDTEMVLYHDRDGLQASASGLAQCQSQVPLNFAYEPAMVVSPSWTLGGPLGTEYMTSDPFFSPVLSDVLETGSPPRSGLDSHGSSDRTYFSAVEDPLFTGTSGSLSPPEDDRSESSSNGRAATAATTATTRPYSPMRLSDTKLRSASRKPKKHRGGTRQTAVSARETRLRAGHNLCEKNYRDRLKAYFEDLLVVLPMGGAGASGGDSDDEDNPAAAGENISRALQQGGSGGGGQAFSRGQVLEAARKRILELERKVDRLSSELGHMSSSPQGAAHRRSVCVGGNAVQI